MFKPLIIPSSLKERLFLLFQVVTFGIILALIYSFAVNDKVITNWFDISNFPIYTVSIIIISLVNLGIKILNHQFKYIEIDGKYLKIVDNLYFPKINKKIELDKVSNFEFRRSFNSDIIKRPYTLWIYQMFFTINNKIEKIPLPSWDERTLELVLESIKKHAPSLKINNKTGLSFLGTY